MVSWFSFPKTSGSARVHLSGWRQVYPTTVNRSHLFQWSRLELLWSSYGTLHIMHYTLCCCRRVSSTLTSVLVRTGHWRSPFQVGFGTFLVCCAIRSNYFCVLWKWKGRNTEIISSSQQLIYLFYSTFYLFITEAISSYRFNDSEDCIWCQSWLTLCDSYLFCNSQ